MNLTKYIHIFSSFFLKCLSFAYHKNLQTPHKSILRNRRKHNSITFLIHVCLFIGLITLPLYYKILTLK